MKKNTRGVGMKVEEVEEVDGEEEEEDLYEHGPVCFPTHRVLQGFAVIYWVAFASIYVQYQGLFGEDGLLPVKTFLSRFQQQTDSINKTPLEKFYMLPTLAWFQEYSPILPVDLFMEGTCLLGMALAIVPLVLGQGTWLLFLMLWILYLSIYSVGQTFLSFQWDLLLLEAGFLVIMLAPTTKCTWTRRGTTKLGASHRPISGSIWMLRFLLFKLMFMAGIVKIQSQCPTWLNLTALEYHYATQCLPTPLAWFAHQAPPFIHKVSVAAALLIEGPAAFLIIAPFRCLRTLAAGMQIFLQVLIFLTGNYTYFNMLTCLLCCCLLDVRNPLHDFKVHRRKVGWVLSFWNDTLNSSSYFVGICMALSGACLFFCTIHMFELNPMHLKRLMSSRQFEDWSLLGLKFTWSIELVQRLVDQTVPCVVVYMAGVLIVSAWNDLLRSFRTRKGLNGPNNQTVQAKTTTNTFTKTFTKTKTSTVTRGWGSVFLATCWYTVIVLLFMANSVTFISIAPTFRSKIPPFGWQMYERLQPFHVTSPYGLFRSMTGVDNILDSVWESKLRKDVFKTHAATTGADFLNISSTKWPPLPSVVSRPEIILEGSEDGKTWLAYHFLYKPGDIYAAPRFVAPHQPRLDWQMWFAALGNYQSAPWLVHLIQKLLEGSRAVKGLLDTKRDPFPNHPPKFIRSNKYFYDFTRWNTMWNRRFPFAHLLDFQEGNASTFTFTFFRLDRTTTEEDFLPPAKNQTTFSFSRAWWTKSDRVDEYTPPLELNNPSVLRFLDAHGWSKEKIVPEANMKFLHRCELKAFDVGEVGETSDANEAERWSRRLLYWFRTGFPLLFLQTKTCRVLEWLHTIEYAPLYFSIAVVTMFYIPKKLAQQQQQRGFLKIWGHAKLKRE